MKINRKQLERELSIAKKIVGTGHRLAVLSSVKLTLYDDGMAIQSTNLSRSYTGVIGDPLLNYWVPTNGEQIIVNLDQLLKIIKAIPKKITEIPFEITWEDHGLKVNGTTTIVQSADVGDYPDLPMFPHHSKPYNLFTYDAMNQVNSMQIYKDDKRAHICHVYADTENGRLVSTDGSRLYAMPIPVESDLKPFMLEKDAIKILCSPQLKNQIGAVRFDKTMNAFIDTGNGFMTMRMPDAEFPDVDMILEYLGQDPDTIISMPDKQLLIDTMNEASAILDNAYNGITIEANGSVIISSAHPDVGEFKKDIANEVDKCGADFTMSFNPKLLEAALKQIPDVGVNLIFPREEAPVLIESTINGFQAAIMPMRI